MPSYLLPLPSGSKYDRLAEEDLGLATSRPSESYECHAPYESTIAGKTRLHVGLGSEAAEMNYLTCLTIYNRIMDLDWHQASHPDQVIGTICY